MIWWFWGPTLVAAVLAMVFGVGAYWYGRQHTYPTTLRASGFKGIVRDTAKITLVGSGGGLLTAILAKDLGEYRYAQFGFLAVLIVSAVAALLNYYMSAALDNRMIDDGKAVQIDSCGWLVVHGVVFGLTLGAIGGLIAVIMTFAASF
jgi:hypothetical protein